MAGIPETIRDAEIIYKSTSNDLKKLSLHRDLLLGAIKNPYINEENSKKAKELFQKLRLKITYTRYLNNAFKDVETREKAFSELDSAIKKAKESKFEDAINLAIKVQDVLDGFMPVLNAVFEHSAGLYNAEGEFNIEDDIAVKKILERIEKERASLDELVIINPFGDDVKLINAKNFLLKKLDEFIATIKARCEGVATLRYGAIFRSLVKTYVVNDLPYAKEGYTYFPSLFEKNINDRVRIINTPFKDEFLLLVSLISKKENKTLVEFDFNSANEYGAEFFDYAFNQLKGFGNYNIAIFGLQSVKIQRNKTYKLLYEKAVENSVYAYIFDDLSGSSSVYQDYVKLQKDNASINLIKISYTYLTMPIFGETLNLLTNCGKITCYDDEVYLKENCKFMGFVGLNRTANSIYKGVECLSAGKELSIARSGLIKSYISEIPTRAQFIDETWGEIDGLIFNNATKQKQGFDYDILDEFEKENVKAIMLNDKTTYTEKCGQLVNYSLLQRNDVSYWENLDREEKKMRIARAVKLLASALEVENGEPEVTFGKFETDDTLGCCYDGGKLIKFNDKLLGKYKVDELVDVICHEIYHSFQHTLEHFGWADWHFALLNVKPSRVRRWKENFNGRYQSPEAQGFDPYFVQVVETDARSFAEEAVEGTSLAWSTTTFNRGGNNG